MTDLLATGLYFLTTLAHTTYYIILQPLSPALEGSMEVYFNYDVESKHSWEPRVTLFGSRASGTESAWSDFDFIVEVPQDYSHLNHIYRQMFRVRLVTFDRDLARKVTTKSSSNIEEENHNHDDERSTRTTAPEGVRTLASK